MMTPAPIYNVAGPSKIRPRVVSWFLPLDGMEDRSRQVSRVVPTRFICNNIFEEQLSSVSRLSIFLLPVT